MATRTTTPSSTLHDHDNEKKPGVEDRPEAETLDAPDTIATETTTQEDGDLEKKPAATPPVGFQVPDGGLDAWLVVAGGWLVLFSTFGFVSGFGVLQVYYVRALEKNDSAVSWIGSFQLWLQFTAGLVVGKLFDEGYGRYLIWFGSALYIFCLYMVSLTEEYWQVFLAQGLGAGIGLGVLFLPANSVIPQWFSRKRATATGIVVSGSSIGGICFPIMLNNLIESHGFPYAMRAAAYTVTGCLIVASFLIRFRLPGRKHRPPHMQLLPPDMKGIMRHTTYWITGVAAWFIMAGLFFPIFFLQAFAEINGIDHNLAFYLLSILNAASFFGRIIPNVLADKLGNFNMVIAACAVGSILNFVMPLCTSKGAVIVLAILYGFCSGAYVSLIPGCIASLSSHVGEIGVRMGIAWAFVATASLIGPPIDGALLGNAPDFHWWPPVAWAGTVVAVGTLFMAWARTRLAHEKGTWRV